MNSYGPHQPYDRDYDAYDAYDGYADSYANDSYGADPRRPAAAPEPYRSDSYRSDSYGADPYPADSYRGEQHRSGHGSDAYQAAEPTRGAARATARASVGAAPAGRARVAPPESEEEKAASSHRYDWSGAGSQQPPARGPAGRATVPVSPAIGGAAAGRARVGGPEGPAGTGPRPAGEPKPKRKKKRRWIRNTLLAFLAVIVMITGGGMVALSYYVDSVPPPELMALEEASTVYYANGREMAVLQLVNREIIDTTVPELENVRIAVVAAEDKHFWDHSGVDFMGIARAAWRNFTGGTQQGASTIDQQYAGAAAGFRDDISYGRKLEEAAMAYKLNQDYSKEEILDFYLNTIYFGRGAYGIQAAAEAYFDKGADELTLEEASVLAGCIRLPDDGSGLCPYDPLRYEDDTTGAEGRFRYVLSQIVDMGELDAGTVAEMALPEVIEPADPNEPLKGPQGNIVRHVQRELEAMGITDWATGGYRITTTIDRSLQRAAREAARRRTGGPLWENVPDNISAAMVAVDPSSGAVLAYYGGDDGSGIDLAGPNFNEETGRWEGGRPPGSTMKIYTLIAAMREGVSFDSHWQTEPYQPTWMDQQVRNAGRGTAGSCEGTAPDYCTLRWATIQSYNVPFAYFSEGIPGTEGPARIVQAAMDAGIRMMTDTREGLAHDLTAIESASEVAPEHFFHPVAYGQYPITVLDHASGMATLAARGVYHEPHFVASVEQKVDGEWIRTHGDQISGEQRIQTEHADAVTGTLAQIPNDPIMGGNGLADGRPAAAKTGTWEHPDGGNRDAWVVGYTPQIATAVWVGDPDNAQIVDQFGAPIGSSGLPAQIWKQFMDAAHEAKEWPIEQFPQAPPVGRPDHPLANGIEPQPEPDEDENPLCRGRFQPPFCNDDDDENETNGGTNGGANDGNDGNSTGGGLIPIPGT